MRLASLTLLSFGLAACAGETPNNAVVRDSAGIRIVENRGPLWRGDDAWRVPETPLAEVGRLEDPAHQFSRIVGATRLSDGRIVVADAQAAEVRFFDAQGRHLLTAGGRGGGPGEFRNLSGLARLHGDTLVASSAPPAGRLVWFDPAGTHMDQTSIDLTNRVDPNTHHSEFARPLPDASLLMYVYGRIFAPPTESVRRSSYGLIRVARDGEAQDTIGWYEGDEFMYLGSGASITAGPTPFSSRTAVAWNASRFFSAETGRYEIRREEFDGRVDLIIRGDAKPVSVTQADRAGFRGEILEFARQQNREAAYQRWLAEVQYPDIKPPLVALAADAEGNLWVREERGNPSANVWTVFDGEGRFLGDVRLPSGICEPRCGTPFAGILEIGSDYLLGTFQDELDVPYVRVYRLIKPDH